MTSGILDRSYRNKNFIKIWFGGFTIVPDRRFYIVHYQLWTKQKEIPPETEGSTLTSLERKWRWNIVDSDRIKILRR